MSTNDNIRFITVVRDGAVKLNKTREYKAWQGIKARCSNSNEPEYKNYGGRGITVCERWRTSFENFLADMGPVPDGYQLDRIDNDGNYEPGNCRWTTAKVNSRNTRKIRYLEYGGERLSVSEWAERLGIHRNAFISRLERGYSVEEAVTTPKDVKLAKFRPVLEGVPKRLLQLTKDGMTMNIASWARYLGISHGTLHSRLRRGMSVEEALISGDMRKKHGTK